MLGKIFGIICLLSLLCAVIGGNVEPLCRAALDGADRAVRITVSLGGMMCLWCGVMRVLSKAGAVRFLSRLLAPFLRFFFPNASKTGEGLEEISANVSANLLGLGNAATPFALRAMEKLQKQNPHPTRATAEQITLAVLNTAPLTLIPANLLALRRAAGSQSPYAVLLPVWAVSLLCTAMALLLTAIPRLGEKGERRALKRKERGRRD